MPNIITKVEHARGCGYRKPGGMYFVSDGIAAPCCKLPFPLTVCPCCNAGIKQSRGFTWINSNLFANSKCTANDENHTYVLGCPMDLQNQRVGLMWVGEKFYPTADHFTREAQTQGVSKRFAQLPTDFEVGKTWIYLAHPKAVHAVNENGKIDFAPGIFRAFKPDRIEYVVTGKESNEKLEALEKRGFTLVKVIPDIEAQKSLEL